jgi:ribonuclease HII
VWDLSVTAVVENLRKRNGLLSAVVDGNHVPPGLDDIAAVVNADATISAVGAASVLAKVHRDTFMVEMDSYYPRYGFKANKGYGTAVHIEALKTHGPCKIHRKSFLQNILDICNHR